MVAPALALLGCWAKLIVVAVLTLMVKALLTTVKAPAVAVKFLLPMRLMLKSAKVAIPLALVAWVSVPDKTPVPVVRVKVTFCPLTGLPKPSNTVTVTAGAMVAPATALLGCPLKLILVAGADVIVKALLTTFNAPAVAVKFLTPTRLIFRSAKVAIPLALVAWVKVPPKTPVPVERLSVTF